MVLEEFELEIRQVETAVIVRCKLIGNIENDLVGVPLSHESVRQSAPDLEHLIVRLNQFIETQRRMRVDRQMADLTFIQIDIDALQQRNMNVIKIVSLEHQLASCGSSRTYLIIAKTSTRVHNGEHFVLVNHRCVKLLLDQKVPRLDALRFGRGSILIHLGSLNSIWFNVLVLYVDSCQEKLASILLLFLFSFHEVLVHLLLLMLLQLGLVLSSRSAPLGRNGRLPALSRLVSLVR